MKTIEPHSESSNPNSSRMKRDAVREVLDTLYFDEKTARADYDLGFTYFIMDMDREMIHVFTRLINSENTVASSFGLKLMALYNN